MQTLIPFALALSLTSATQLVLLPSAAYLADPLPVYHRSQDTRSGEHAYSYAGGPSAAEEVRARDGVTRGSYSYLDGHGRLQSVFYVADDDGFRVAATNLPTDDDLPEEPSHLARARSEHLAEHARALVATRRRRSLETVPTVAEFHDPGNRVDDAARETLYGPLARILIPGLPTATSQQSRFQVHSEQRVEPGTVDNVLQVQEPAVTYYQEPLVSALFYTSQVPTAVSHQSRSQLHSSVRVESADAEKSIDAHAEPIAKIVEPEIRLPAVPVLNEIPTYYQDRIQFHENLGLEGPERKDAVKIKTVAPVAAVQLETHLPVVQYASAYSVPTAVSSQSRSQIHSSAKVEISPAAHVEAVKAEVIASVPVVTEKSQLVAQYAAGAYSVPTAVSSQSRNQVHSGSKIEIAPATVETFPVRSVPIVNAVPVAVESVPLATSSQSRAQIHSSQKLETLSPIYAH